MPFFFWVLFLIVIVIGLLIFFIRRACIGPKVPKRLLSRDLVGRNVVVTGPTSGIGLETAIQLGKLGATVYCLARSESKFRQLSLPSSCRRNLRFIHCELSQPGSVRSAAAEVIREIGLGEEARIDILVCNAGIGYCVVPPEPGHPDLPFRVNHVGHFVLVKELMPYLRSVSDTITEPSRIVLVSSEMHQKLEDPLIFKNAFTATSSERDDNMWVHYCRSKVANISFGLELSRRLKRLESQGSESRPCTVCSVCPGMVFTNIHSVMPWYWNVLLTAFSFLMRNPKEGAATSLYCSLVDLTVEEDRCRLDGKYLRNTTGIFDVSSLAADEELAIWLWEQTEKYIGDEFVVE